MTEHACDAKRYLTDCKSQKCWCKDLEETEATKLRNCFRILQDRVEQLEALPKFQFSYHNSVFDRIQDLESWMELHEKEGEQYGEDFEKRDKKINARLDELQNRIATIHAVINIECRERLDKIDEFLLIRERVNASVQKRLDDIEKRMSEQLLAYQELRASCNLKGPYSCPICDGEGWKESSKTQLPYTPCGTCEGHGIVWKP